MQFINYGIPPIGILKRASARKIYKHVYWLCRWAEDRVKKGDRRSAEVAYGAIHEWVMSSKGEIAMAAMRSQNMRYFS